MKIQIRTKDDLVKLLSEGISYAWRVNKGRLNSITEVEIYNFNGNAKIVGSFDREKTKVLDNGRVAVAFTDAKIEPCEFKWVGQYPIKYKSSNNEEVELLDDEKKDENEVDSNTHPIDKIAEGLKNNFLFQASLGSKELFHSNMLAWILEHQNEKKQFEALSLFIKEVAKLDVGIITDENTPIIAREQNKIDLTIKWKEGDNWNLIFIENKMKSIPTSKQLEEYDDKIDVLKHTKTREGLYRRVKTKLLLTPFPSKVQSNSKIMHWENITYSDHIIPFLSSLEKMDFLNNDNTNIKFVIERYISFLNIQNDILEYLKLHDWEAEDFKKRHYDFYSKHAVESEDESEELFEENEEAAKHYMSIIRTLRLHDLVLKLAHSNLSHLLEEEIEEAKKQGKLLETYHYHSNFTNSTGLTAVSTRLFEYIDEKDKTKNKHIDIGIQLQGNQFRYYLSSSSNMIELNIELARKLLKDGIWFYNLKTNKPLLGKGRSKRKNAKVLDIEGNERVFCEYSSGGFLYFYQDVYQNEPIPTIERIIQMFVSAFIHYEANKTHIEQILGKILKS
jgi:hypothetical protein